MSEKNFLQQLIAHIDLTSLNETDNSESIKQLCLKAITPHGSVAAICVYSKFIAEVKKNLEKNNIKIAVVSNFPNGNQSLAQTLAEIKSSVIAGADEIDVVMPYRDYLVNQKNQVLNYLENCRAACGKNIILKIILETGALITSQLITEAANIAIAAGADFVKTSTGKIAVGATPEAVSAILTAIKNHPDKSVGIKISGGIRNTDQAKHYYSQVMEIMGSTWISPQTLRFGASRLIDEILKKLED